MNLSALMERTLLLDLETTRGGRINRIGAILNGHLFERTGRGGSKAALAQLDDLAKNVGFVLGHNLLGHDFPILKAVSPGLKILAKPVIDTLYLSPLAFPENPYHRLVKDYKLVRSSINRPVDDARLAASVFKDQWNRFVELAEKKEPVIDFYRFCFRKGVFNTFSGAGISSVLGLIAPRGIKTPEEALACFAGQTAGNVCEHAVKETLPELFASAEQRPSAAYCLAWLQVAGGNSVLPPWVRHRFPGITSIIKTLREVPCGSSSCRYCAENHNPEHQLTRHFGYPSFREKPQSNQGGSLQREIVTDCMGDRPVLAILPTGGGKSLCYQLPALVRYWRRGALTVVISPLLALMKDQVDNLVKKTGTLFAEAVYGLQTSPERGEVFDRIRLGDTAILYIAPEQLRSLSVRNVLKQRDIGCWVFDEAHCLSKWGHDFRPDYLYAARYIREFAEEQNQPVPPICCFTATAKTSVIEEISDHFQEELGQELALYAGGVERENLSFEVIPVPFAEKLEKIHEIVVQQLEETEDPAGIIVYAATRKVTEEIRDILNHQGLRAAAFHGGMDPNQKREVIDAFVAGETPVICATNAFGMGIDKENIRLVLHYEMPGSLENYIQEAGRAGRDMKPARCVLLYDPQDAGKQFQMGTLSELNRREIARILRALKRKKRNRHGEIVVTSEELLRDDDLAEMHGLKPELRDTKVRSAVAWLERAGYLQRNQNLTEVFQGKPLVESLEEAQKVVGRFNLNPHAQHLWLNILHYIMNSDQDRGIRADAIAEALFPQMETLQEMEKRTGQTAGQIIISALHDMADAGLIDQGVMLSAIFRPKGKNNASVVFRAACDLENKLVRLLQEADPDADNGNWVALNIRRLNQKLDNEGYATSPDVLRQLIKGISYDGKGFAASQGSFELKYIDRNRYQVRLQRSWRNIRKTIFLRHNVSRVILDALLESAKKQVEKSGGKPAGEVQLSFTSDDLSNAIKSDITLRVEVKKVLPAIDRALMFLHEQKVITLQSGLAVLRQAMTLRLSRMSGGRSYNNSDFKPLAAHYREKRLQVHVMIRYATLALEKLAEALRLVLDYFALGRVRFINKYFKDDKELLEKATTAESYRAIVEKLRNPVQISAIGSPVESNMLILAGPGSGKTTVIVHRCAYLLEVERIPAHQILVLCFNYSSAVLLRKRLINLVGKAAKRVTVATYHAAAMRLAGISLRDMDNSENEGPIDFDAIIEDAVKLIKGEKDIPGLESDELRDGLLSGYSHILVDEYQDIDAAQYEMVSAIAGRSREEGDGRLTILAVGDDDQNIYTFRGANVRFIRKFQEDYKTKIIYLVENYRSSRNIIAASNSLIRANRDRMKGAHPIVINREREPGSPGGKWEQIDPVGKGRVQIVAVENAVHQAGYVKSEIDRIQALDPNVGWRDFAVLSRTKFPLPAIRSALEDAGYPLKTVLDKGFPLQRIREVRIVLDWLSEKDRENLRASDLEADLKALRGDARTNVWWRLIDTFFEAYGEETADSMLPAGWATDRFYDFIAEQNREKVVGHGIFLSTIHSAKGMEFPHVFILDGDWCITTGGSDPEEERRVMYVGMTRAEESLRLLKFAKKANPFLKEIKGQCVASFSYQGEPGTATHAHKRYELLSLEDIYLDFAGTFPKAHQIHRGLENLESGTLVSLVRKDSTIEVHDEKGACLARLSKKGADVWRERIDDILEVRVVAMLRRSLDDPDDNFVKLIKADAWELPVLEVVYTAPSG